MARAAGVPIALVPPPTSRLPTRVSVVVSKLNWKKEEFDTPLTKVSSDCMGSSAGSKKYTVNKSRTVDPAPDSGMLAGAVVSS
jgi:hypothetical protein